MNFPNAQKVDPSINRIEMGSTCEDTETSVRASFALEWFLYSNHCPVRNSKIKPTFNKSWRGYSGTNSLDSGQCTEQMNKAIQ
jgi:hypothetical protein